MGSVKSKTVQSTVADAVSNAFSEIDSIREELQSWYDNLHENFQNGEKGQALQDAVSNLESCSEPTIPSCIEGLGADYTEYHGRIGRPRRRDTCVNMLDAAISAANERVDRLNELEYSEDDKLIVDGEPVTETDNPDDLPLTEADRETQVGEIEDFVSECENAKSEWENVEFPGMYG